MKITPIAYNHCIIELDNGEVIDVNDGTKIPKGLLTLKLKSPTDKRMIVVTSITYDASVSLYME